MFSLLLIKFYVTTLLHIRCRSEHGYSAKINRIVKSKIIAISTCLLITICLLFVTAFFICIYYLVAVALILFQTRFIKNYEHAGGARC
jgi:membrane protein insertase Oxa1/YidC/SpoIIIJ